MKYKLTLISFLLLNLGHSQEFIFGPIDSTISDGDITNCLDGIWKYQTERGDQTEIYQIYSSDIVLRFRLRKDGKVIFTKKSYSYLNYCNDNSDLSTTQKIDEIGFYSYIVFVDHSEYLQNNSFKNGFCYSINFNGEICDRFVLTNNNRPSIQERFLRTNEIPYSIIQYLYLKHIEDSEDYLLGFFNLSVKSICVDQLDVFDEIDGDNLGYLVKDDLVEVIEEQGDWVQVKYLKSDQAYWTYMSCLE